MSIPPRHVSPELLDDYLAGSISTAQAMSVSAHLEHCRSCRDMLPIDETWLAASWDGIEQSVVAPRRSIAERILRRSGIPEHVARLLVATPTLSSAWLVAVIVVLMFGAASAHAAPDSVAALLPFLVTAPVAPLTGIALAYGPQVDPAYELVAATPTAGARLLLMRSSMVLTVALAPAGIATLLLPEPTVMGAAWLLPALALTVACLVLSTRVALPTAAAATAAVWVTTVFGLAVATGDRLAAFQSEAQLAYSAVAVMLAFILVARRRHLDPGGRR